MLLALFSTGVLATSSPFELVGNGFCRACDGSGCLVNGFRKDNSNHGECLSTCLSNDGCIGFAFANDLWTNPDRCYIHGASDLIAPDNSWEEYTDQENYVITTSTGFENVECYKKNICNCDAPLSGTAGFNTISCSDGNSVACAASEECYATSSFVYGAWDQACRIPQQDCSQIVWTTDGACGPNNDNTVCNGAYDGVDTHWLYCSDDGFCGHTSGIDNVFYDYNPDQCYYQSSPVCADEFSTDTAVMTNNGWDLSSFSTLSIFPGTICPVENLNGDVGSSMQRVFSSVGSATLKFGNCMNSPTAGSVRVYLNDVMIATVSVLSGTDVYVETTFQFVDGDVLKIDHTGQALISIESFQICEDWPGIYFEALGLGKCVDNDGNFPSRYFNGDTIHIDAETCEDVCQVSHECIGYSHLPLGDKHTCILYLAAGTDFQTIPEGFVAAEMDGTATDIMKSDGTVFNDDASFTCNKKVVVQCTLPENQEGYLMSSDGELLECFGALGFCDDYTINGVQCEQFWTQSDEGVQVSQCTTEEPQVSLSGCVKNEWQTSEWSDCSANCDMGSGYQFRTVTCSTGLDDCNPSEKPDSVQTCESFQGQCEFDVIPTAGGTCAYAAPNNQEGCLRQCVYNSQWVEGFVWGDMTNAKCETFCREDPYCRGYNLYAHINTQVVKCALQTLSDCMYNFQQYHAVSNNVNAQANAENIYQVTNVGASDSFNQCNTNGGDPWQDCKRKVTTFTGTGSIANYWDYGAVFQSKYSGPQEFGPDNALVVTKTTPVETEQIWNWDPSDNVQGKGGVISAIIADRFFDAYNWDGAIFQVLVNGMDEIYITAHKTAYIAAANVHSLSMVFQYPIAEENDWSANDVIMSPIRQCRFPDTLPVGYRFATDASDAFLVHCSTETDACATPQFGGIVCDNEIGFDLSPDGIEIIQCDWPSTDFVQLSGCTQTVCNLPNEQVGFDTSAATLSNCDATENGCDEPIIEGLECAENYASFPGHFGVNQCTVADPVSTLVGCYEVIHQEIDATFWTEADAQLLCQNMADELNGLIYECTLSDSTRRRLAEGFAHTLVVRVGVPHLENAIDQLSQDGFLQAVLPDGMEPHHINLQEPYQLFMEQPTVAPTVFVVNSGTSTQIESSSTSTQSVSTLIPAIEDESIVFVDEHDWFAKEILASVLASFAFGSCVAFCCIRFCIKANTVEEKGAPFVGLDLESKLSNSNLYKAPSNSMEWLDLGLGTKFNSLTKIWSEVANEHE